MKDKLKVASFNVQSFRRYPDRGNIDMSFSSAVARELRPDILGLNEVSSGPAYGAVQGLCAYNRV